MHNLGKNAFFSSGGPQTPLRERIARLLSNETPWWLAAGGGFVIALIVAHVGAPQDLRTPAMLFVYAAAAALSLLIYAAIQERATRQNARLCVAYGLWMAAMFRLVPSIIGEAVLFDKGLATANAPAVVLGALVHGAILVFLSIPFARRMLNEEYLGAMEDSAMEVSITTVLVLAFIAAVVRVVAELH